jgi:SNF2 family DNA or RNA helicase
LEKFFTLNTPGRNLNLQQLKQIKNPQLTIPGLFNLELFPFQKIGVIAAVEVCPRMILGDSVGLGKSIQSLAAIQMLHNLNQLSLNDTLVICPGAAKEQWLGFFKEHTAMSSIIAETSDSSCKYLKRRYNNLIMSFSTMRSHVEVLKDQNFKMVVVDEGLFKNSEGRTFQALQILAKKSPRLLILNANQLENCLDETYSHIELIQPGMISKQEFMDRFCKVETKFYQTKYRTLRSDTKIVGPKSIEALQELKTWLSNFYIARTPEDAGMEDQLPKQRVKVIYVDLKKSQKIAYLEQLKLFKEKKLKAPSLLPNLLRICHGKREKWKEEKNPEEFSAKADAFIQLINSIGKEPFVFYSTFNDPLLACAKIVTSMGRRVGFFTGLQKEADRQRHLAEFKRGERNALFINNAAQRALNIETCRYLLELNQLYNPTARNQLRGRIRRLSSKFENVFVYSLIAKGTVEERILELQDKKEELANYINSDGECPQNLTDEQLEKLLGKRKSLINKESLEDSKEVFESELA